MTLTYNDIHSLINGRIVENTNQEITADDLNDLLHQILEYANVHKIADSRIYATIARVNDMNTAINNAKNDVKAEIKGNVTTDGDTLEKLLAKINLLQSGSSADALPSGIICMWSGTVVPTGWKLCNGAPGSGTPNLTGRFIVGYNPSNTKFNQTGNYSELKYNNVAGTQQQGKFGGSSTFQLEKSNIPRHHHEARADGADIRINMSGSHSHSHSAAKHKQDEFDAGIGAKKYVNDYDGYKATINNASHLHNNSDFRGKVGDGATDGLGLNATNAESVEHLPPYYVLAYIMKD